MDARSDIGVVRTTNEDAVGIFEKDKLAVVCDGMGGHHGGEIASRLAVKTVSELFHSLDDRFIRQITSDLTRNGLGFASRLIAAIRLANQKIFNQASENLPLQGMGTTLSALAIQNGFVILCHVGDSRIYRLRNQELKLLTEDHTWLNELVQDNEIDANEADKLINKNVITRALGYENRVKIDLRIEPVETGDVFLLCTDGLTKALADDEIECIILFNKNKFDHTLKQLIDDANMKNGSDNITAAIVAVEKATRAKVKKVFKVLTLKPEDKKLIRTENIILKQFYSSTSIVNHVKHKTVYLLKKFFSQLLLGA
jgi:protein phosphatase